MGSFRPRLQLTVVKHGVGRYLRFLHFFPDSAFAGNWFQAALMDDTLEFSRKTKKSRQNLQRDFYFFSSKS